MSIIHTKEFFEELTQAVLRDEGWEIQMDDKYIYGSIPEKDVHIMVYTVGKCLSLVKSPEDTSLSVSLGEINRIISDGRSLDKDYIPCISFGIARYSIDDFEIYIVPIGEIKENSEKLEKYRVSDTEYSYDYEKVLEDDDLNEVILRRVWKTDLKYIKNF